MRCVLALLLTMACSVVTAAEKAIDRTFVEHGDVTHDGRQDSLTLHIAAKSMQAPFRWTFSIADDHGRVLYRVTRDDAPLNDDFKDVEDQSGCHTCDACKAQYYFGILPSLVFACQKPAEQAWPMDDFDRQDFEATVRDALAKQGLPEERIRQVTAEMRATLSKPGFRSVTVPYSQVNQDFPMIWVASLRQFVPFYRE